MAAALPFISERDRDYRKRCDGMLMGMRVNRYSWWTHWREIADYLLPRRYRWLITPNMQSRGSPINQHILDSTGTLAARNLAAGLMSGVSSPTRRWFDLRVGTIDTTQTSPISLWLAEVHRLMTMVFAGSNFYSSMAILYLDLVVFGTAVMLIYEDHDEMIRCHNPCLGEYYLTNGPTNRPETFGREFTYTIQQLVEEFGRENCPPDIVALFDQADGSGKTKEVVVAHLIEPNKDPAKWGFPSHFKWREAYWIWQSTSPQGGVSPQQGFLRKKGYHECPFIAVRWDLVSNDPYGRSPGMDALPDIKQLQLETRRKAQAIDKMVNPPMVADIQLKNQPASLLPGGVTYVSGMTTGKVGFASAYTVDPKLREMMEDLNEVKERIKTIFYNNLFQMISQFEPKSNITAVEIDARRSEQMIMLSPVLERLNEEGLKKIIDRTYGIVERAGILPEAPPEIAGAEINVDFISMLEQAQDASAAAGIERVFGMVGNLVGVTGPDVMDNVDVDYGIQKYSSLLNNDPKLIRAPQQLEVIRQKRAQEAQMAQQQQAVDQAEQLAKGAKTLSETPTGAGSNALEQMIGVG